MMKTKRQTVYREETKEILYYIIEAETINEKIIKISEYYSKDMKKLNLIGAPYTINDKEHTKGKSLEEIYNILIKKAQKLDIYDIVDEKYGEKVYGE